MKTPFRKLKNAELDRLDPAGYRAAPKHPLSLLLDDIRSFHNVGSLFRTADAFRLERIYLCGICPRPPHKDIHKTALGATESVAWEYTADAVELGGRLKEEGFSLVAVEQAEGAVALSGFQPEPGRRYVLILGHEVNGVRQELIDLCDAVIEIPQYGTKHSLNVSVAGGVVVWDLVSKLPPLE